MNKKIYFSKNNADIIPNNYLNDTRAKAVKRNNIYIISLFSHLMYDTNLSYQYQTTLELGQLPNEDKVTGCDSRKLGQKLRFLANELKKPEQKEKFKNSDFYQFIMDPLFSGAPSDASLETWSNYENLNTDERFKNKNAFTGAAICNLLDEKEPIGLNMADLIDGIVKEYDNGNFVIVPKIDETEKGKMRDAIFSYIDLLKGSKGFKNIYRNDNIIENDNENENE